VTATVAPTPIPTPTRSPRLPDYILEAQARATIDGIGLPKVFPYKISLYEPLGNYHAGFGGFQSGVAVLLIGRDDVRSNTVTHEYGHAWHEYFMKYDKKMWAEYGAIRGFTDQIQLYQGINYLDDWRERFANDFQFAFNPDYEGRFAPSPGYWDPQTYDKFKTFVKALPTHVPAS
jgi:hypothetical protein